MVIYDDQERAAGLLRVELAELVQIQHSALVEVRSLEGRLDVRQRP